MFVTGGLFIYTSVVFGGAPDGGWFGYAPLSVFGGQGPARHRMDFYSLGLQIVGVGTIASGLNVIVTTLNMRAPGMRMLRLPVFTWTALITSSLIVFALPILAAALLMLSFDGMFGTSFFDPGVGGDPMLWQHLFWLFGHPEVYLMILPAWGVVSEVLPVFSRKPLFGYSAVVFSSVAIGFMGFGVWTHHMFTSAIGPVARSGFALASMAIAVPTGIKIFNWTFTMWGGKLRFATAMLFAMGLVVQFTIGGLSGVMHAVAPHNYQQTDTYFVVAHFHYVLFGGALFGLISGLYFWWPKVFGRFLDERLGKINFWTMVVGFNLTFFPMHLSGLYGQPRRTYTYSAELGPAVHGLNLAATIGAFILAAAFLVLLLNIVMSFRRPAEAPPDPWDGRTLEWLTSSPPPPHNYDRIPLVEHRDEAWYRKYSEDAAGRASPRAPDQARALAPDAVEMPAPSYWPLLAASGLPLVGYGIMYGVADNDGLGWPLLVLGTVLFLTAMFGWMIEPLHETDDVHAA